MLCISQPAKTCHARQNPHLRGHSQRAHQPPEATHLLRLSEEKLPEKLRTQMLSWPLPVTTLSWSAGEEHLSLQEGHPEQLGGLIALRQVPTQVLRQVGPERQMQADPGHGG